MIFWVCSWIWAGSSPRLAVAPRVSSPLPGFSMPPSAAGNR
ncbi:hypothetical protein [Nonomuraea dietziae]